MQISRAMRLVLLAPIVAGAHLAAAPQADPQVTRILDAARAALGGDEALAGVRSLSATGAHRRMVGEREIAGDLTLDLLLPDKMKRTEEVGIPGGPRTTRTTVLDGNTVGTESTNRGGGLMRFGPRGGPRGEMERGGRELTGEDRARLREAQVRRLRQELARRRFVWLLRADSPVTHVGTAEAEDGRADVLGFTAEDGSAVRLFIDQASRRPLMLTYEAAMPRLRMRARGGQRPPLEERERMPREPPQRVTFEMRFAEYRDVDGVLLPHLITESTGDAVIEEWTIEEYKVNPSFKPDAFQTAQDSGRREIR